MVLLKGDIGSCKQIKLCDDVVSMGRDAACLIQLDDKMFADSRDENIQYVKLSRVHFTVTRDKHGITLVDKSMNGTYVNKLLVGSVPLCAELRNSAISKKCTEFVQNF